MPPAGRPACRGSTEPYGTLQAQMLMSRCLAGLGVGGLWPNGIALVAESWPSASQC